MKQGVWADRPASFQCLWLLTTLFGGLCLSGFLTIACVWCMQIPLESLGSDPWLIRFSQLLSAACTFLLPALCVAWTCGRSVPDYLSIGSAPRPSQLAWVLGSLLMWVPFLNIIELVNRQLQLPEWLAPVEWWMQAKEQQAEAIVRLLMSDTGWLPLAGNLLVIALTAGITEEFLFRGCFQRIFRQGFSSPHTAIWLTAVLFSAIHLQFYGFIPRLLLGAYFGYLLLWSRNLWIPVFAHFCNNALVVLTEQYPVPLLNDYFHPTDTAQLSLPYQLLAVATLLLFVVCIRQFQREVSCGTTN
ncbi:MAG: lysostaphin resistance A-like protein [Parabacteroides sp.]